MMNLTNINVLHPIAIEEPNRLASFSVVDLASFDEAQATDIYEQHRLPLSLPLSISSAAIST